MITMFLFLVCLFFFFFFFEHYIPAESEACLVSAVLSMWIDYLTVSA